MSAILTSIPPYFSRLREFAKKSYPSSRRLLFTSRWMYMPLYHGTNTLTVYKTEKQLVAFPIKADGNMVSLKARLLAYNICQICLHSSDISGRCFITLDYFAFPRKNYTILCRAL